MRRILHPRFRLSTLMLLTAAIAAACVTWVNRSDWYVTRTIPTGFQHACGLAVLTEQDLLICLKSSNPRRLQVRRLGTGELLEERAAGKSRISYLVSAEDQVLGHSWHELYRLDPLTGETEVLMRTPNGPPESEQIVAVSPQGKHVLIAAHEIVRTASGGSGKPSTATVTYRVCEVASSKQLWELATPETSVNMGAFSADGRRTVVFVGGTAQVWDFRRNERIRDTPVGLSPQTPPLLFKDGRRMFANFGIWDLDTGDELAQVDFGSHYGVIVNDSFLIADCEGTLRYWRRRRIEGTRSPVGFPEPWIAGALAVLCVLDVVRHARGRRSKSKT